MPLIKTKLIRITNKRSLKSYAGVDYQDLQHLLVSFSAVLNDLRTAELKSKAHLRQRKSGGGRHHFLETDLDKVLFTLHYLKTYPTFDNLGTAFKVSKTTAHTAVHYFVGVLHLALIRLKVMPKRQFDSPEDFLKKLEDLGGIKQIIIDATERTHRRCCKKEHRDPLYSGKKKRFTVKNTVITTLKRWIVFVGLTTQGSMHDYELLKEEFHWYQNKNNWFEFLDVFLDLGYLGFEEDFKCLNVQIPFKRPKKLKNQPRPELPDDQKEHNSKVAKTRVRVEHAIGAMKIFNIMVHAYRNFMPDFEDITIGITAAINNLRLNKTINIC